MKELLLQLCKYPFDEKNREILSKLIKEVRDWDKLVKLINAHGIIALATYNIKEGGLGKELPKETMEILENGSRQSMVRNTWLFERWKEVNYILCNAGIKYILLKGMALEHTIYEAKGLRQMTDNDVLIKKRDSIKAWQLLLQNGFEIKTPKSSLHNKIMADISQHLPALYKDGYALEIHVRLFDEKTPDEKEYNVLFNNAVEITINGSKAFILPKDIHLKYLIKHFSFHAMAGDCQIRTYNDIKLLDPENNIEFPESFLYDPAQSYKRSFRKAIYKANVNSVPPRYRLRFIAGDIFPSVKWMKERYKCTGLMMMFYYPHRLGKLLWLLG